MSDENNYKVVFKGEVTNKMTVEQVKENLARLFKASDATIEKLFSGKSMTIKKNMLEQKALSYQKAMSKAGAITHVIDVTDDEEIYQAPPTISNEEDQYAATFTYDRYIDRFASVFVGFDASDEQGERGVLGVRYLLPMNIESSAWIDTDAEVRVTAEYEIQLTNHLAGFAEAQYDSDSGWESVAGVRWLLDRGVNLVVQQHSEFGWGAGLSFDF